MRAYKFHAGFRKRLAEAVDDKLFDAADVGDDGSLTEVFSVFQDEIDDLIRRESDDDEIRRDIR